MAASTRTFAGALALSCLVWRPAFAAETTGGDLVITSSNMRTSCRWLPGLDIRITPSDAVNVVSPILLRSGT